MSDNGRISTNCLTPILYVRSFSEATDYYTKKLLFDVLWQMGKPTFIPKLNCEPFGLAA